MSREDVLWADALLVDVRQQADPTGEDVARNLAGLEQRLHLDAPGDEAASDAGRVIQGDGAAAIVVRR